MKGDRVEIVVDTGNGAQRFEIVATRAGRRVDISVARGVVEVTELTRGGTAVRAGRFMANRVIALVEHPAADVERAEERPPDPSSGTDAEAGERGRRRGRTEPQLWAVPTRGDPTGGPPDADGHEEGRED